MDFESGPGDVDEELSPVCENPFRAGETVRTLYCSIVCRREAEHRRDQTLDEEPSRRLGQAPPPHRAHKDPHQRHSNVYDHFLPHPPGGDFLEIFQFDRDERLITRHESVGLIVTRIAAGDGPVHLTHLKVEPGGTIGTHPAASSQMFLVITGDGWIAGPDGTRTPITAGQGVCWDQAEDHTSGTDNGLTAIAVEGTPLALFAPEAPSN